jgi:competence protein ComEC
MYGLRLPPGSTVNMGDVVSLSAVIRPVSHPRFRSRGEVGWLEPTGPIEVKPNPFPLWRAGSGVRDSFLDFLRSYADWRLYGLIAALCFNVTSDLSPQTAEQLSRSGLIHIVSTGGLHIFLVAGAVGWALGQLPVPRVWQLGVLLALVLLYAAAAGFRPPMVRSMVMIGLFLCAYLVRREPDGLTLLSAAGTGYLLWSPESVANIGFQLSYLAVAGLVLFAKVSPLSDAPSLYEVVRCRTKDLAQASFVATVATAPAVAHHFQRVSLVSPLTNLLVVPVVTPVVLGSLAAWLLSFVSLAVGVGLLKLVVEPLAAWILMVTELAGSAPFSAIDVNQVPAEVSVIATLLVFSMWRPKRRLASD